MHSSLRLNHGHEKNHASIVLRVKKRCFGTELSMAVAIWQKFLSLWLDGSFRHICISVLSPGICCLLFSGIHKKELYCWQKKGRKDSAHPVTVIKRAAAYASYKLQHIHSCSSTVY
jgi:hypothetical protein